jgi:WD40 repeat protein
LRLWSSKTLVMGGSNPLAKTGSFVKFWDVQGEKVRGGTKLAEEFPPETEQGEWRAGCLAFAPDSGLLAAAEWGERSKRARVQLYDVKTGKPKREIDLGDMKEEFIFRVAFMADGKQLLSACGPVKLWDAETGKELRTFDTKGLQTYSVAVSPDGRHLATSGFRKKKDESVYEILLWDAKTGEVKQTLPPWRSPSMWTSSLTFSPDGKSLAVSGTTEPDVRVKDGHKTSAELKIIPLSDVRGKASDPPADDKQAPAIRVGPNVHVSQARAKTEHQEVVIAADPKNAGRLLAGSMIVQPKPPGSYPFFIIAYRSSDAGKTWEVAIEPEAMKDTVGFADPAVAYAPDGSAYFAAVARDGKKRTRLQVRRSRDGGKEWVPPIEAAEAIDRPYLAVDWTGGKFAGRLYASCHFFGGAKTGRPAVYASADAGKSFGEPRSFAVKGHTTITGQGGVLSDGTLVVPYRVRNEGKKPTFTILVRRSTTGGESSLEEQSVWVDDFLARNDTDFSNSMLAVDPGSKAFKDRLYLVWSQKTEAGYRVQLTLSQDKGVTWARPVVINEKPDGDGVGNYEGVLPAVAVNREGVVGVSWFEWRKTESGEVRGHEYFRASVDGGATWLPRARVTDKENRFGPGDSPETAKSWLGDTSGLAADAAGDFHPLWVDNRTGTRQVFTAAVHVKTP